ncbi:hypothetical protein ACFLSJ_06655 [Verrucomicrobiota bacterium]
MDLTREQRIARHKSFLNANWGRIAAFAWERYQAEGRGMVVVPEEDFVEADAPELRGLRFAYAAEGSQLLSEAGVHFEEKERAWLRTYDPGERAIVIVLREGGGLAVRSRRAPTSRRTRGRML